MAEDKASFAVQMHDGVTSVARRMRSSIKSLRGSFRELQSAAKNTGLGSLRQLSNEARGFGKLWTQFSKSGAFSAIETGVGKLKDGLLVAGAVAVGTAAAIGSMVIKFADFAQVASLGFKSVAKHGASSEKLFMHARTLAEDLGLDVLDTTKTFTKFLALQFDPKMATDLIKMGSDLRAFGATGEEIQRIFSQLGQIQAKGKLQGEELIVLAENGVSTQLVYEQLQKTLGKTKDEIMKMQQAGKLTSDMAFPAIMAAVMKKTGAKELGQVGKEIADTTLGGMAGRMKAQFQNAFIDIARDATPAIMGAFKPIADEISQLLKNKELREGLVVAFEQVGKFIKDAIPFVKTFVGALADGFKEAWPAIKGALEVLFQGFGGKKEWMENVKQFGHTLGQIGAFAIGLTVTLGGMLAAAIELGTGAVRRAIAAWDTLIRSIGRIVFVITDTFANIGAVIDAQGLSFFEKAKSIGSFLMQGLAEGIKAMVMLPVNSAKEAGNLIIGGMKDVLRIKSPSEESAFIGEMLAEGISVGFVRQMRAANDNMARTAAMTIPALDGPVAASVAQAPDLMGASTGGAGGGVFQHNTFKIEIHQQPGQSAEELVDELERRMRRIVDARLEELDIEAA